MRISYISGDDQFCVNAAVAVARWFDKDPVPLVVAAQPVSRTGEGLLEVLNVLAGRSWPISR